METQALEYRREVEIQTCIKLELTAVIDIGTRSVDITEHVGEVGRRTTQEVLAINDIAGSPYHSQRRLGIRVNHIHRNQRSHAVRTEGASLLPVAAIIVSVSRLSPVEGGIRIYVGIDGAAQGEIHITSYIESVGIVLLSLAEVQVVTAAIVTHVGIEARLLVAAFYFGRNLRAVERLLDVIRRIEVNTWIAIWILAGCIVVDGLCRIWQVVFGTAIIEESLVVESHVLSRTEILRKSLGYIPTRIGIHLYRQAIVNLATLSGNENHAIGSLAAIEHCGLGALQKRDILNLVGANIIGITWHTVDEDECIGITPHTIAIITGYITLHVVKAVGIIVFLCQFSDIDGAHTTEHIALVRLLERHVNHCAISRFLSRSRQLCQKCRNHCQSRVYCFLIIFHINMIISKFMLFIYHISG